MQGQRQPAAEYQYYDIGDGRLDDGDSAMERAGYPRYVPNAPVGALGSRLGPRVLPAHDVRNKLDRLDMSRILEEEGPPGPACFADRISREPPVPYFQLPRGQKTYNGSTKPEDWLNDYVSAVHIAGGNRRWAMKYIP